ncbi:hypothetical protein [Parabacteroides sp. PF5-6]|uniref:hypothetical protein n=1 Tax=Parabacteroides sp. PF5-6 TaxID=1742403 RepID=UPI0024053E53|nr:hypothetical protein [Parabacteroides sp. PF5-6]MDF9829597.1 hypothetical protein [Parabacteroides sp. PF5-6]
MIKKLTYTSLLWIVFSWAVPAQTGNDTLFHTVAKRLHEFQYNTPREKVYVHQDRTQYVAGETMWFKVYQSSSPEFPVESGVVYVELINGMNQAVAETKWKLENGSAAGHIELPDTLTSGLYQLRAYTQWMQNFDAEGFFTRELRIASRYTEPWGIETEFSVSGNTLSAALRFMEVPQGRLRYKLRLNGEVSRSFPLEPDEEGIVLLDIELPTNRVLEGTQFFIVETPEGQREFPIPFSSPVELSFFPEGGHLVAGLPSKLAFKVTDRQGKGIEASGVIQDLEGNEVRRFETQYQGMGSFSFEPEAGKRYIARLDDSEVRMTLPDSYAKGLVMSLGYRDDRLRITLRHNLDTLRALMPFYLTIHQEGTSWFNARVNMQQRMNVFDIPKEKLPTGVFVITIYDENLFAYTERLAFVNYPERLEMKMKPDKAEYGIRQKVTVEMEIPKQGGNIARDFSVAVVKSNLDDANTRNNIYTDYFLTSELKGRIDNPEYYFNQSDSLIAQHLDLLLQTHGWRRYLWDRVVSERVPDMHFPVEKSLTFSGRVYPRSKSQKMEDIELTASFRQDTIHDIISFHPGEEGLFMFTNYDFRDTAEVILSAQDHRNRILDISLIEHQKTLFDYYSYGEGFTKKENQELYVELKGTMPQGGIVGIDKIVHQLPEVSVTAKKKRHPHKIHNEAFSNLIYEVRRDMSYSARIGAVGILLYVPNGTARGLGSRFLGSSSGDRINVDGTKTFVLLDGVRTSVENLKSIPPGFIDHVEMLSMGSVMHYTSGSTITDDVFYPIAFWTRDRMSYAQPVRSVTYKFPGYNQPKEFYSPDYAKTNEYINPDHRNTLYWQPHVTINADGKAEFSFFTSDDKGEYVIHCEGKTEDGEIGTGFSLIQIN